MTRRKSKGGLGGLGNAFSSKGRRGKKSPLANLGGAMRSRRRGRGNRQSTGEAMAASFDTGKKRRTRDSASRAARDTFRALAGKLTPTERIEEQERTREELEHNPTGLAREVQAARMAGRDAVVKVIINKLISLIKGI